MSDIVQGSDAWLKRRLGKATASRQGDLTAKTKTGYAASRTDLQVELLIERLTQQPTPRIITEHMRFGTITEPEARASYSFYRDVEVVEVGFIDHPMIRMAGASPDGLVGDDGLIEIKCPKTSTFLEIIESEKIPLKYMKQMQFQMACTERSWCDFVCYDPRVPEEMRLYVQRVNRDDEMIAFLESETIKFLTELDVREEKIRSKYMKKGN